MRSYVRRAKLGTASPSGKLTLTPVGPVALTASCRVRVPSRAAARQEEREMPLLCAEKGSGTIV